MKIFLTVVFIACVIGIIGSFNSSVYNFFRKIFFKIF